MKRHASMSVLFLTVFIDLIGFGIVLPLLPFFASHFGVSGIMVTSLSAVFSLMQFLSAPFWGKLSDRIGRRPVLLISLAGSSISYLALGFCTAYWQIFATRLIAGFFGANIAVANAYIADITSPENRSRGMGMIGAAFGLGFVLGPAIGAIIAHVAQNPLYPERVYHAIGWVAGTICAINWIIAWIVLVESHPPGSSRSNLNPVARGWFAWKRVFLNPVVAFLIILYFILGFGFSNFENLFALLIRGKFGYDIKEGNYFFLWIGLVVAAVQGGLIGYLVKKFGESRLIVFGSILFALSLGFLPWARSVWHLLMILTGLGLSQGLNRSSIMGMISQQVSSGEQGEVLGIAQSAGSLARIMGPLIGGMLFDHIGPVAPFIVASLFVWITLVAGSRFLEIASKLRRCT